MAALELQTFKSRLDHLRDAVRTGDDFAQEAMKPVALSKATVGGLARMDAMKGQIMATEMQRRHGALGRRVELALAHIACGDYGVCQSREEDSDLCRLGIDSTASLCTDGAREAS